MREGESYMVILLSWLSPIRVLREEFLHVERNTHPLCQLMLLFFSLSQTDELSKLSVIR